LTNVRSDPLANRSSTSWRGEGTVLVVDDEPMVRDLAGAILARLGGGETFRQIRDIRPDALVILMSGYNEQEASGHFAGKGLAGFLEKLFSTQALRVALERVIGSLDARAGSSAPPAIDTGA
jgi:CheY-like chemotaxis protein